MTSKTKTFKKAVKEDPNREYIVEKILKQRVRKGEEQFLVKWENYGSKDNSWETRSNLANCIVFQEYEREQAATKAERSKPKKLVKTRPTKSANTVEDGSSDEDEPTFNRRKKSTPPPQRHDDEPSTSEQIRNSVPRGTKRQLIEPTTPNSILRRARKPPPPFARPSAIHRDLDSASGSEDEEPKNFDGRYFSSISAPRLRRSDGKMEFLCGFTNETDEEDVVFSFMKVDELYERFPDQMRSYYGEKTKISDEIVRAKARKEALEGAGP